MLEKDICMWDPRYSVGERTAIIKWWNFLLLIKGGRLQLLSFFTTGRLLENIVHSTFSSCKVESFLILGTQNTYLQNLPKRLLWGVQKTITWYNHLSLMQIIIPQKVLIIFFFLVHTLQSSVGYLHACNLICILNNYLPFLYWYKAFEFSCGERHGFLFLQENHISITSNRSIKDFVTKKISI